jgi:hypothetical protein
MDHGDALFAHAAGRRLQVQLRRHRDDKDEIIPAGPLRHQCLVHAGRVLAHALGHMDAVHGHALLVGILMRRIGHLGPLQNPHRVGFCFFSHTLSSFLFSVLYNSGKPRFCTTSPSRLRSTALLAGEVAMRSMDGEVVGRIPSRLFYHFSQKISKSLLTSGN